MNEQIKQLALQAGGSHYPTVGGRTLEKFAELLIQECDRLNRAQSRELTGVVVDTEQGGGFDNVCLDTVKRVESYLANDSIKKHFGVES
jgi:hypothetical protein